MTAKIFHPLLALIASASSNELAKYVEFLKEENKILRARIPGQVHTKPDEQSRLIKLGKALGQAIEELITLVAPSMFYRWCREAESGKKKPNPKGGQRKSREIREFVIEIAKTIGFGYTRIIGELRKVGIKGISRQTVRNILKEEGSRLKEKRRSCLRGEQLGLRGAARTILCSAVDSDQGRQSRVRMTDDFVTA